MGFQENMHTKSTSYKILPMSVVQWAEVCGRKVLLTGDAGVRALSEAREGGAVLGLSTEGVDWFQVPHHGSRRNLSSDVLDDWLGQKLAEPPNGASAPAIISANRNDNEHPKKAVVRALIHRGRRVIQTKGTLCTSTDGAPTRAGWTAATPLEYPEDQED